MAATLGPDQSTFLAVALLLGGVRALGIMTIFPLFTLFNVSGIVRIGVALGLSAPVILVTLAQLKVANLGYADIAVLGTKEFCFGVLLGAGFGIPFWAAQAAGDMTDVYRGANQANIFDQVNALETTTLGSVLLALSLMLFVGAGGLYDLMSIFYRSFLFWPILDTSPKLEMDPLLVVVEIFVTLFKVGAVLASPYMIVAFAVELSFSYIGRSARQLPINDTLPVFKNIAVLGVFTVYTMFIGQYVQDTWTRGFGQLTKVMQVEFVDK